MEKRYKYKEHLPLLVKGSDLLMHEIELNDIVVWKYKECYLIEGKCDAVVHITHENIEKYFERHFDEDELKYYDDLRNQAANAVLDDLYNVFNNVFEGVKKGELTTVNQVINPVLKRMKELKGE